MKAIKHAGIDVDSAWPFAMPISEGVDSRYEANAGSDAVALRIWLQQIISSDNKLVVGGKSFQKWRIVAVRQKCRQFRPWQKVNRPAFPSHVGRITGDSAGEVVPSFALRPVGVRKKACDFDPKAQFLEILTSCRCLQA